MWLERFLIVVPSLEYKFLPYAWGHYRPTWAEITLVVSGFALISLLYLLFAKFVPIISVWELKAGAHPAPVHSMEPAPVAAMRATGKETLLTDSPQ